MNLASLAQKQVLNLEEPLVDANKMVTNVSECDNILHESDIAQSLFSQMRQALGHFKAKSDICE